MPIEAEAKSLQAIRATYEKLMEQVAAHVVIWGYLDVNEFFNSTDATPATDGRTTKEQE